MEPDRLAELTLLVRAQEDARQTAERQIVAVVSPAVLGFSSWYDSRLITEWARDLVARVEAVQRVLARATDAYLARVTTVTAGRTARPVGAVDVSDLRTGVTHAGAYGRVADSFRYQEYRLKQHDAPPLAPAAQVAMSRAVAVAETDALLVPRAQSREFMGRQQKLTGYRRVIHPELSASGTCGLCVAASDRVYKPRELMPIHDRCHCLPMPIYDRNDPGSALNSDDLSRLYADAGGKTYGGSLKRTRYRIVNHSELGPTLVSSDAAVRTPADVKRDERS